MEQASIEYDCCGCDYAYAPLKIEHRPSLKPFSKDKMLDVLDVLEKNNIKAWWFSAAKPPSHLLFASKIMPYAKDTTPVETYRWLSDECHKRGIAFFSHYCLHAAPLLLSERPELGAVFIERQKGEDVRSQRSGCYNTEFGQLLKELITEIVVDLNFDGVWLDCTGLAEGGNWFCACNTCNIKFKQEIGYEIPREIDFKNPVFRKFVKWRQGDYLQYIKSLEEYVKNNKPDAMLVLNFANRLNKSGAKYAMPMRAYHGLQYLVATEVDWRPNQAILESKYTRAVMENKFPTEAWLGFSDGTQLWKPSRPNPAPEGLVLFGLTCIASGGYPSYSAKLPEDTISLAKVSATISEAAPFLGRKPVTYAGLYVSNSTLDFAHTVYSENLSKKENEQFRGALPAFRSLHGMHYLLNSLHIPSEVVLENQLNPEYLQQFEILVLSDIECMSKNEFEQMLDYVKSGGKIILTGETGMKDEWGNRRKKGLFDDLLGIKRRAREKTFITLENDGRYFKNRNLPPSFMISGKAFLPLVEADNRVVVPAKMIYEKYKRTLTEDIILPKPQIIEGVGLIEVKVGKGKVIYLAPDVGYGYAENNNVRTRMAIREILINNTSLPYEVSAPANVYVSPWKTENGIMFHVLNQHQTMTRLDDFNMPIHPEDVIPTGPIVIKYPGKYLANALFSDEVSVSYTNDNTMIQLSKLGIYDVLVLKNDEY